MTLAAGNTYYFDFQYSDISEPVNLVKKAAVAAWTITEAGQSAPSYYSTTLDGEFQAITGGETSSSSESSSEG